MTCSTRNRGYHHCGKQPSLDCRHPWCDPPRADEKTSIAGFPARVDVGAQIYNQALPTVMVAKVTQGNQKLDDVIKWAEAEIEGYLRT